MGKRKASNLGPDSAALRPKLTGLVGSPGSRAAERGNSSQAPRADQRKGADVGPGGHPSQLRTEGLKLLLAKPNAELLRSFGLEEKQEETAEAAQRAAVSNQGYGTSKTSHQLKVLLLGAGHLPLRPLADQLKAHIQETVTSVQYEASIEVRNNPGSSSQVDPHAAVFMVDMADKQSLTTARRLSESLSPALLTERGVLLLRNAQEEDKHSFDIEEVEVFAKDKHLTLHILPSWADETKTIFQAAAVLGRILGVKEGQPSLSFTPLLRRAKACHFP